MFQSCQKALLMTYYKDWIFVAFVAIFTECIGIFQSIFIFYLSEHIKYLEQHYTKGIWLLAIFFTMNTGDSWYLKSVVNSFLHSYLDIKPF